MNNSPSNIFQMLLLLERYYLDCPAVLTAAGMNGLISHVQSCAL